MNSKREVRRKEKFKKHWISSRIVHLLAREEVSAMDAIEMLRKANSIYSRQRYRFFARREPVNVRREDNIVYKIVDIVKNPRLVLDKKISARKAREIFKQAEKTYLERSYHELCKVKTD